MCTSSVNCSGLENHILYLAVQIDSGVQHSHKCFFSVRCLEFLDSI